MRNGPANPHSPRAPTQADGGALVELIHDLSRCHRLLRAWLNDRLRPWEIRDTEFFVLWLCDRHVPSGVVQHELAAAAGVSEAQMSGVVERLRQHGLLIGCRGEPDRRRQYWRLTAAGHELLARLCAAVGQRPPGPDVAGVPSEPGELAQLVQKLAHSLSGTDALDDASRSAVVRRSSREADDETSHRRAS